MGREGLEDPSTSTRANKSPRSLPLSHPRPRPSGCVAGGVEGLLQLAPAPSSHCNFFRSSTEQYRQVRALGGYLLVAVYLADSVTSSPTNRRSTRTAAAPAPRLLHWPGHCCDPPPPISAPPASRCSSAEPAACTLLKPPCWGLLAPGRAPRSLPLHSRRRWLPAPLLPGRRLRHPAVGRLSGWYLACRAVERWT